MKAKFSSHQTRFKKTLFATVLGLATSFGSSAAEGPPGTDIFMADLSKNKLGFWQAGKFEQITTRKGYDNQPYFLPDGSGLLYTAMLPMSNGLWQADSFEYNFASKKHTNLTNTDLSEYSPTLMASGRVFSAVVVEKDNKQHLWGHPFRSKTKPYRLSKIEPVGYHVWGNKGFLAMFVLADDSIPGDKSTLQFQPGFTGKPKVVAKDIGRSLRFVAERESFTFSHKKLDKKWWLSEYQPKTDTVTALVPLPKGSDYYTWIDGKTAVTAVKGEIHLWQYNTDSKTSSVALWMPWLDVSDICKTKVSRLAVDNKQSKIAFVCNEK